MPEPRTAKDEAARDRLEREAEDLRRRLQSLDRDLATLTTRRRTLTRRLAAVEEQLGLERKRGAAFVPSDAAEFEDLLAKGLEGLGRVTDATALRLTIDDGEPKPDDPKR